MERRMSGISLGAHGPATKVPISIYPIHLRASSARNRPLKYIAKGHHGFPANSTSNARPRLSIERTGDPPECRARESLTQIPNGYYTPAAGHTCSRIAFLEIHIHLICPPNNDLDLFASCRLIHHNLGRWPCPDCDAL